ncbi:hypothetical protein [Bacillus taeanensis]|uniref:Uncharacterized protein n=1 Tax=Bacillus taeanensis TaxID=273032 RepID=A0A366XVM1_9BACI|nr:hypothetical protein [Bacillus taeanensis]RBW68184.1 hypothetical protein DS031_18385 [Bacillus taeanensis]
MMIKGKERVRFDCVGTIWEPHIYKCKSCEEEFRYQLAAERSKKSYLLSCPSCEEKEPVEKLSPKSFEIVGVIEDPVFVTT